LLYYALRVADKYTMALQQGMREIAASI